MSIKIVFMGTPEFSVPTLDSLIKNKFNILKVYTQPPKKSKRGQKVNASPIEEFCKKAEVSFCTPEKLSNNEEFEIFKNLSPDIVIVVAYGQIIPKSFLKIPKFGFINIHASLLPKWRGAAPIQRAIMNGDKRIGASIMKIEEKLDTGPILASKEFDLDQNITHGEIEKKLSIIGADLLIKSLQDLERGNSKFIEQIHSDATYAKKIDKKEGRIDWKIGAPKIIGKINGLFPSPGAFFSFNGERYKILKAEIGNGMGEFGEVISDNLEIACGNNQTIKILEIQREGKNPQKISEFMLGSKIKKGSMIPNV